MYFAGPTNSAAPPLPPTGLSQSLASAPTTACACGFRLLQRPVDGRAVHGGDDDAIGLRGDRLTQRGLEAAFRSPFASDVFNELAALLSRVGRGRASRDLVAARHPPRYRLALGWRLGCGSGASLSPSYNFAMDGTSAVVPAGASVEPARDEPALSLEPHALRTVAAASSAAANIPARLGVGKSVNGLVLEGPMPSAGFRQRRLTRSR